MRELAVTEHLFRFRQAESLLGGFWADDGIAPALQASMAEYWDFHATADLDEYVRCAQEAKDAGLPIVIGLEVDYYPGRMDEVGAPAGGLPLRRPPGLGPLAGRVAFRRPRRSPPDGRVVEPGRWTPAGRTTPAPWRSWRPRVPVTSWPIPDLIKVAGHVPDAPTEWWDRMAEAAAVLGHGGRALLGGLAQAGGRAVSGPAAPGAVRRPRACRSRRPRTRTARSTWPTGPTACGGSSTRSGSTSLQGYRGRVPHRCGGTASGTRRGEGA